ncbi:MAG: maleylpyruvate isomerase family mycothiol-dependent enzyme [Acidimicrobiales bacterium]
MQLLDALAASVTHLHELAAGFSDDQLESPAYPSEWTVAQVLSHLGSGAVIFNQRIEDGRAGREMADDFAPSVWEEWNAKTPSRQRADLLVVDASLLERLQSFTEAERAEFSVALGPMTLDFAESVSLRVNEHVLHTWDVEVPFDDGAVLLQDAVGAVIDRLGMITTFTAKSDGVERTIGVRTTDPDRIMTVNVGSDGVGLDSLAPGDDDAGADLTMPSESFIRLVYGRLDRDHSSVGSDDVLDQLRAMFPGV